MAEPYDEDEGVRVWHEAVASLLARGRSPLEALDGANMILEAWKRKGEAARGRTAAPVRAAAVEHRSSDEDSRGPDSGARVWHDAVVSLRADRRSPTEIFIGANLIHDGWQRLHDGAPKRGASSGGGDGGEGSSAA